MGYTHNETSAKSSSASRGGYILPRKEHLVNAVGAVKP